MSSTAAHPSAPPFSRTVRLCSTSGPHSFTVGHTRSSDIPEACLPTRVLYSWLRIGAIYARQRASRFTTRVLSHKSLCKGESLLSSLLRVFNKITSAHPAAPNEVVVALATHTLNCIAAQKISFPPYSFSAKHPAWR
jgi:hypothetical protein